MGKGKVHPSPSPLPAAAVAGGGREITAEAVLMRLLPAVVLAAAAPLGAEAKEVLAYLVLASLRSPTPLARVGAEEVRAHRPELGCGCFGCYTAYWSRWNGSPEADREAIHRAIEAFEEHLARKEEEGAGGKGRRGRKKRAATATKEKNAKGKGKGKELAVDPTPAPPPPPVLPAAEEAPKAEDNVEDFMAEMEAEKEDASTSAAGEDAAPGGEEEKRRRGWGSVLYWRSWGLWASH